MASQSLKKSLHQLIDKINDEDLLRAYLRVIKSSVEEQVNEEVAGYSTKGEALTNELLKKKTKAASKRVKGGKYLNHDDVVKESKTW